jgi:hypothetical protein
MHNTIGVHSTLPCPADSHCVARRTLVQGTHPRQKKQFATTMTEFTVKDCGPHEGKTNQPMFGDPNLLDVDWHVIRSKEDAIHLMPVYKL